VVNTDYINYCSVSGLRVTCFEKQNRNKVVHKVIFFVILTLVLKSNRKLESDFFLVSNY
jgi:hypothetical protein